MHANVCVLRHQIMSNRERERERGLKRESGEGGFCKYVVFETRIP